MPMRAIKRWFRERIWRGFPKVDLERISSCCDMIEFVDNFSEPSRTKFRAKYAREIQHILHEHEREIGEWIDGRR